MRRLACTLLFAACSTGDPLVVVTVSSPLRDLTALARLHATATAAGHTKEFDVSFADGHAFDLPPDRTFGVEIPEAYAGEFAISVDAVDGTGATVISGAGSTNTSPGRTSDVTIRLGETGDGGDDGGGVACAQANYGCGMMGGVDCGPCMLTSLHPPIARGGDTITLEGAFNPTLGVSFPGAAMPAMPTLLGPNRATVVVPAGATAGPVALQVGAAQAPLKQPFRRVTFDPALHEFHPAYQQVEAARPMAATTSGHIVGATVLAGNLVEVIGGEDGPSPTPAPVVELAVANADGTVGIFAADTTRALTVPRSSFAVYNAGSSLYIIGGYDRSHAALSTLERAPIRIDGIGTGSFAAAPISLSAPRWLPAVAVIGGYLYVFGGGSGRFGTVGAQLLKTVERSAISESDGSLGAFSPGMSPLSLQRAGATAVVLRDRVYLIGGIDGAGKVLTSIDSAPINGDGSLGQFTLVGPSLKVARAIAGVVQLGNRVYVLGGLDTAGGLISIESAPIDAAGALMSFGVESFTLKQAHLGQPLLLGNYLHYFEFAPGERAAIGGGSLGPFGDTGRSLLMPRSQMTLAVVGPDAYLFGGIATAGPTPNVVHARVDPDGTLGSFSSNGLPDLTFARAGAAAAVFDRDIWICGGSDGVGARSDCEGFTAHPDGTLTALAVSADMTVKRAGFQLVVLGNQLYAVGGDGGGWDSVQSLALDGTRHPTGAWSAAAAMQFPAKGNGRYAYLGDATDYVFGGDAAALAPATATYTGALSAFTAATLVQGPQRYNAALAGLGSWVAVTGGSDQATGNAVDTAWLAAQGGDFADTTQHLVHARRGHNAVVFGNYVYVIGGSDAGGQLGSIEQAPLQ